MNSRAIGVRSCRVMVGGGAGELAARGGCRKERRRGITSARRLRRQREIAMKLVAATLALALPLLAPAPTWADTYPSRPITMIVVFAPGGPTDVLARIVADHMGRTLGQRVIVENLAGAGGTTGGARGAKATPDGYTLTVGSLGSHGAAAALYKNIQYDARELEPIGLIAGTPGYFVVRKDFPAQSFPEFVAHVRA